MNVQPAFPVDRRLNRSECPATALELALTGAARRAQLDAVLVADDDGLLVSHSLTGLDLEGVAAIAPIVGRGHAIPRVRRDGELLPLSVRTMVLEGETLHVAALGGEIDDRIRELELSIAATQRILA